MVGERRPVSRRVHAMTPIERALLISGVNITLRQPRGRRNLP